MYQSVRLQPKAASGLWLMDGGSAVNVGLAVALVSNCSTLLAHGKINEGAAGQAHAYKLRL